MLDIDTKVSRSITVFFLPSSTMYDADLKFDLSGKLQLKGSSNYRSVK
jgi:hypothetical protein